MKKLILLLVLILAISRVASAVELDCVNSICSTPSYTLLSATTVTGTPSAAVSFKTAGRNVPVSEMAFTAIITSLTFTNWQWEVQCSENCVDYPSSTDTGATTFTPCAYWTQTEAKKRVSLYMPATRCVRVMPLLRTGGTATSTMEISISAGGLK